MSDEFDFSGITRIEIPVTGPNGKKYILKEADGAAAVKYRNAVMDGITLGEGTGDRITAKKITGQASVEPLLVSLCLFDAEHDKPVHISVVQGWPYRVQKKLYDKVKEISELDEEDPNRKDKVEEQTGNESTGSQDGSD